MPKMVLTDMQLRTIQQIETDVLCEVDRICKKHQIKYVLGFGTLIGAVRHQGFIPWDDDVDICMMRKDYERFKDICKTELNPKYFYQSKDTDPEYYHLFDKIRVNGTVFKEDLIAEHDIHHGVYIDIYAFFFVSIIVLQSNNFVVSSISGLFGRSATFTGRSLLWRMAIDEIIGRPFLGYGYTAGNINVWGGMFSSHNMFLEILLQGGLFSFLLFIAITWLGIKRNMKSPIWLSNTAFLAIFCMLLKGLMETSIPTFYYVIITIAYDAPYLVKQYNERREDIVST